MNTRSIKSVVLFLLASLLALVAVLFSTATSINSPMVGTHSFIKKLHIPRRTKPVVLSSEKQAHKGSLPHYRIAILVSGLTPVINLVIDGFEETLESEALFTADFRIYEAKADRILLRTHIEDILNTKFDLVHSLGMEQAKMLKEVCEKRGETIPIVFNLVKDPAGSGLIESEQSSGNNLTGIPGASNIDLYSSTLATLLPQLKNVLIVYNPTQMGGGTEQYKREVQTILESRKIHVKSVEVFNPEQIVQRTPSQLEGIDAVVTVSDSTVNVGIQHLVKLCDLHGIPLVAPYLESSDKGVAICWGMYGYKVGAMAAQQARQILEDKKLPSQIPVCDLKREWQMVMKKSSMKKQGLKLDSNIEFLVRHTFVVGKSNKN